MRYNTSPQVVFRFKTLILRIMSLIFILWIHVLHLIKNLRHVLSYTCSTADLGLGIIVIQYFLKIMKPSVLMPFVCSYIMTVRLVSETFLGSASRWKSTWDHKYSHLHVRAFSRAINNTSTSHFTHSDPQPCKLVPCQLVPSTKS